MIHRDDVKLINCADCGRPKVGLSMQMVPPDQILKSAKLLILRLGYMGGYVDGRPYCVACYSWRRPAGSGSAK